MNLFYVTCSLDSEPARVKPLSCYSSEEGTTQEGCKEFYLKAKSIMLPGLSHRCHIRPTAAYPGSSPYLTSECRRAKGEQLRRFKGLEPESQGYNTAVTFLYVPYSLNSAPPPGEAPVLPLTVAERRGNELERFKDVCLEAKASIWP